MGYLHSTDISGRAWGLLSVNWTHPLHVECRFPFMCPVLSMRFAFLREYKNPCVSSRLILLLIHVLLSTFYKHHQEYRCRSTNISAILHLYSHFVYIFWISVTHLWKRLCCFCSSLGSFVLLPHGLYFSNVEFPFWVACSGFVPG